MKLRCIHNLAHELSSCQLYRCYRREYLASFLWTLFFRSNGVANCGCLLKVILQLLQRKQMVVDIIHPTRANLSKDELRDKLSAMYKAPKEQVIVFGFRTQFGGGKSTGFALIYDNKEALKFEPKYRLIRFGMAEKKPAVARKLRKERKNRAKKFRGTQKKKADAGGKKK